MVIALLFDKTYNAVVRITKSITVLSLLLPALTTIFACVDEHDSFEDFDVLRPTQIGCPNCTLDGNVAELSLGSRYDPASITDVTIELRYSSSTESISYGTSLNIPNEPSSVTVTDNEFCTVGSTGQPPTSVVIEFELDDGMGPYAVTDYIDIIGTCP